jgi:hypothetical protein
MPESIRYRITHDLPALGWKQGDTVRVYPDGLATLHRGLPEHPQVITDALSVAAIRLDAAPPAEGPRDDPKILAFRRPRRRRQG